MSVQKQLRSWIASGVLGAVVASCANSAPPPMLMPISTMPMAPSASTSAYRPQAPVTNAKPKPKPKSTKAPSKTSSSKAPAKTTSGKPAPSRPSTARPPAADPRQGVAELLHDIQEAADRTKAFVATAASWSLPVGARGNKEATVVQYTFARPMNVAVEVLQSSKEGGVGAKIVWAGGDKVKVRTKILGMPIKVDLPINDDRLANQRKFTFADTAIQTWYDSMMDPRAQVRILGKMTLPNGREGVILEVKSPRMKPQITKEIYGVDSTDFTPLLCQMYEGETCVYEVQVKSLALNPQLPADAFQT